MLTFVANTDYKGRFECMTLEDEKGQVVWTCYGLPEAIEQAKAVAVLLDRLGHQVDTSAVRDNYYYG